jgi:mono/diheme cytochrome c family protein
VIDEKIPAAALAFAILTMTWLTACSSTPGDIPAQSPSARSREARIHHQGERLYNVACSGCHALNARGNGPVAPLLEAAVPDLTLIASRRGGSFPEDEIYRIIDGQANVSAHGPRHMPVWGYEFFSEDPDDEAAHREATEKIERLVRFLQSIQRRE